MGKRVAPTSRSAREAAIGLLSRRDRTRRQLIVKLINQGFDSAAATAAVAELEAENLVNDGRFIEHFVAYHAERGDGPMKIRHALRVSEVDAALVESALQGVEDWPARAARVRAKKFGVAPPTQYAQKVRQARFLTGRGFTGAHVRAALDFDHDET